MARKLISLPETITEEHARDHLNRHGLALTMENIAAAIKMLTIRANKHWDHNGRKGASRTELHRRHRFKEQNY